jgi:predicted phage terminase large subunit-like protein
MLAVPTLFGMNSSVNGVLAEQIASIHGKQPRMKRFPMTPGSALAVSLKHNAGNGSMCGLARLSSDVGEIKVAFRIPPERPRPNIAPSWNVAPTDRPALFLLSRACARESKKIKHRDKNGGYWLLDMVRARANPGDVERLLINIAAQDGNRVRIGFGQDPGQAGKSQALHLVRALSGFTVSAASESGDKITRLGPFSAQCRAGNVKILRGAWNEEVFRVLEGFPDLAHDDEVDACSGALEMLNPQMKSWGLYELYRQQAEQLRTEKEGR